MSQPTIKLKQKRGSMGENQPTMKQTGKSALSNVQTKKQTYLPQGNNLNNSYTWNKLQNNNTETEKDFIALNTNSKFKNVFTKDNYDALKANPVDRTKLSLECRILLLQIEKPEKQYVLRDSTDNKWVNPITSDEEIKLLSPEDSNLLYIYKNGANIHTTQKNNLRKYIDKDGANIHTTQKNNPLNNSLNDELSKIEESLKTTDKEQPLIGQLTDYVKNESHNIIQIKTLLQDMTTPITLYDTGLEKLGNEVSNSNTKKTVTKTTEPLISYIIKVEKDNNNIIEKITPQNTSSRTTENVANDTQKYRDILLLNYAQIKHQIEKQQAEQQRKDLINAIKKTANSIFYHGTIFSDDNTKLLRIKRSWKSNTVEMKYDPSLNNTDLSKILKTLIKLSQPDNAGKLYDARGKIFNVRNFSINKDEMNETGLFPNDIKAIFTLPNSQLNNWQKGAPSYLMAGIGLGIGAVNAALVLATTVVAKIALGFGTMIGLPLAKHGIQAIIKQNLRGDDQKENLNSVQKEWVEKQKDTRGALEHDKTLSTESDTESLIKIANTIHDLESLGFRNINLRFGEGLEIDIDSNGHIADTNMITSNNCHLINDFVKAIDDAKKTQSNSHSYEHFVANNSGARWNNTLGTSELINELKGRKKHKVNSLTTFCNFGSNIINLIPSLAKMATGALICAASFAEKQADTDTHSGHPIANPDVDPTNTDAKTANPVDTTSTSFAAGAEQGEKEQQHREESQLETQNTANGGDNSKLLPISDTQTVQANQSNLNKNARTVFAQVYTQGAADQKQTDGDSTNSNSLYSQGAADQKQTDSDSTNSNSLYSQGAAAQKQTDINLMDKAADAEKNGTTDTTSSDDSVQKAINNLEHVSETKGANKALSDLANKNNLSIDGATTPKAKEDAITADIGTTTKQYNTSLPMKHHLQASTNTNADTNNTDAKTSNPVDPTNPDDKPNNKTNNKTDGSYSIKAKWKDKGKYTEQVQEARQLGITEPLKPMCYQNKQDDHKALDANEKVISHTITEDEKKITKDREIIERDKETIDNSYTLEGLGSASVVGAILGGVVVPSVLINLCSTKEKNYIYSTLCLPKTVEELIDVKCKI